MSQEKQSNSTISKVASSEAFSRLEFPQHNLDAPVIYTNNKLDKPHKIID